MSFSQVESILARKNKVCTKAQLARSFGHKDRVFWAKPSRAITTNTGNANLSSQNNIKNVENESRLVNDNATREQLTSAHASSAQKQSCWGFEKTTIPVKSVIPLQVGSVL